MKYFYIAEKAILLFFIFIFFSCASKKDVIYYQNIDGLVNPENSNSYEIKIQADDLLLIIVSADDAESAVPFNLSVVNMPSSNVISSTQGQQTLQSYLVDYNGEINFPVLGKLKVGGLTRSELLQFLREKLEKYIKNPIINVRITNFKFSLQGEVMNPGTYSISSERVTLIEALAMAKDLTIYGRRDNILIIRELNGVKSYNRVDITKADFINSPFYYLAQNDVVYVEPNKVRVNGAGVGTNTGVIISATSLLITLITLIVN